MATAFAARGAKLVLADIDDDALARTRAALESNGATVLTVRTDVGERTSVEALLAATLSRFGAAHVVCNNAGIALAGPLADATAADWDYTMRVNFWGVVHGVSVFVPHLIAQGQGGHVVNTASMAGLVGMEWLGVYCASKFAVVGLTEALQREVRPHGIGVSVLCPMIVQTAITANSIRNRPAALRNPGAAAVVPDPDDMPALSGSVIPVEEVSRRVVRAIDRGDFYVLTHPEQREILRRRAARQDAMFEPDRW
jgi:NAD(P)-dependent dehydrogenase (short-subunit alcohol dehydrogenase family)